jgi:hypothetical protein
VAAPQRFLVLIAIAGCTPEPASTQEILQTVQELVDQGRAMAIENEVVALAADVDPERDAGKLRDAVAAALAEELTCAVVTPGNASDLKVAFGDGCEVRGRSFTGSFTASYTRPNRELLVTVNMQELASEGTTLSGATRVMWGVDSTLRLVGELRLDVAGPDTQAPGRQIEIQSDRIQRVHQGVRQVDGWQRWQTLMGKWQAELGGWEQVPSALLPARGLTLVDTPFEHDVVVDHREVGDGSIEVRVNGGRADRVFMVAADGTITDLGED